MIKKDTAIRAPVKRFIVMTGRKLHMTIELFPIQAIIHILNLLIKITLFFI